MASTEISPVAAIQEWLDGFASKNTVRTYYREFKRMSSWLASESLSFTSVVQDDLNAYLLDFALGSLATDGSAQLPRKVSTVEQAANVLNRMFAVLQSRQLRADNPAQGLKVEQAPATEQRKDHVKTLDAGEHWTRSGLTWLDQPLPEFGSRSSSERSAFLVTFTFWTCLQRAELAQASMDNIRLRQGSWYFDKKGKNGRFTSILLPSPAIRALARYRHSRGLSAIGETSADSAPLISRIKSERAIDAWTIGNILRNVEIPEGMATATAAQLRRSFIARGLQVGLSESELRHHTRSRYVVEQMTDAQSPATKRLEMLENLRAA